MRVVIRLWPNTLHIVACSRPSSPSRSLNLQAKARSSEFDEYSSHSAKSVLLAGTGFGLVIFSRLGRLGERVVCAELAPREKRLEMQCQGAELAELPQGRQKVAKDREAETLRRS